MRLFLLWSTCDSTHSSFSSLLHSFVGSYLYYPNKSTLLHLLLANVLLDSHGRASIHTYHQQEASLPIQTHHHEEAFVVALLNAGCDKVLNHADKDGQRPLHIIVDRTDIFKVLINHGAHIDAVNVLGKSALPTGTFGVSSLYCTAANAIVMYSLPYQSMELPYHVVQFIMLHDPHTL